MKPREKDSLETENGLLHQLLALPDRIIKLHSISSLPQIVLHELCHDHCFGIEKAAYLIDNPDFNCVRGVAGYCKDECTRHKEDVWSDPHSFNDDMKDAPYHQEVQCFSDHSVRHAGDYSTEELHILGQRLGIAKPLCFTWGTKHDNNGILIVESDSCSQENRRRLLYNVLSLLSLC